MHFTLQDLSDVLSPERTHHQNFRQTAPLTRDQVSKPETLTDISFKLPQASTPLGGLGVPEIDLTPPWEVALFQAPLEQRGQDRKRMTAIRKGVMSRGPNGLAELSPSGVGQCGRHDSGDGTTSLLWLSPR